MNVVFVFRYLIVNGGAVLMLGAAEGGAVLQGDQPGKLPRLGLDAAHHAAAQGLDAGKSEAEDDGDGQHGVEGVKASYHRARN